MEQPLNNKYPERLKLARGLGLAILVIINFIFAAGSAQDFVEGPSVWVSELGHRSYGEAWQFKYLLYTLFFGGNTLAILYYLHICKSQEELIDSLKHKLRN